MGVVLVFFVRTLLEKSSDTSENFIKGFLGNGGCGFGVFRQNSFEKESDTSEKFIEVFNKSL